MPERCMDQAGTCSCHISSGITQVCMSTPKCEGAGKWSAGMVLEGENDDFDKHLTIPVHGKKNSF